MLVVGALAGCAGAASGGRFVPPAMQTDLANPPEVVSHGGVARLRLRAVIDPKTGGPALEYNGRLIPPTIRVAPGDTIALEYVNALPPTTRQPLNVTNLHFHGLTTSPNPPGDDVINLYAMPGQTLHYVVHVPKTDPPGAYWYHSHAHLESNWQVFNGMSGAIVVTGTASFVPRIAGLPERIIVLRNVLAKPKFRQTTPLARRSGTPAVCRQPFNIPSEYTTINGQRVGAHIAMQAGQAQLWRVINGSSNGYYDVSVDGVMLRLVALDGVPLDAYPHGHEQMVRDVMIPPAGRAEFVVKNAAPGAAFRTTCFNTGPAGDPNPSQVLAIVVKGKPQVPNVAAPGRTPPPQGTYERLVGHAYAAERPVVFTENGAGTAFYLNGKRYNPNGAPMFTARVGTIERWTLVNDTREVHAFHIHQIHFIVQDVGGVPQPRVWRDTVNLPYRANGIASVTHVLLDFRNPVIRGTFVFHCHLLQHEDLGMMAKIAVQ